MAKNNKNDNTRKELTAPANQSKCDHEWNDDLSTCVKCGDKDWMN